MEFPNLGKHCTADNCKQLDFLPFTCYHCKKIFCQEHYKLEDHHCPSLNDPNLDVRVPTCPICEQPVPGRRDQDPNIRVNEHIQNNCRSEKKPSNLCKHKGCKAKLLVPMQCTDCHQAFCVKHRLPVDHDCAPPKSSSFFASSSSSSASSGVAKKFGALSLGGKKHNHSNSNQPSRAELERQRLDRLNGMQQKKQELARLQEKAKHGRLSESEQVRLATLMSLADQKGSSGKKDCIIS
ncbi:hypothetical protein BCR43DRAFT_455966 [Syncephalastrum racemosum]|uniref:AN1-type domain-containing protein n=1 Tax=Syncephalastrum racemosum TaxID=13706 RepID=A0A1X2HJW6_SYNRA|nr:hypothetical protein BCR43DRAFT_455966 [Syncephalastrum racemosum]